MRVLLDECLPRQLAALLGGHQVVTVAEQRWTGLANGRLLRTAAAAGFEVFLTADQNLQFQQSLAGSSLAVVILRAGTNRLVDLLPLVPKVLDVLDTVPPGEVRVVADGPPQR